MTLSQSAQCQKMLEGFGMENSKPVPTPMEEGFLKEALSEAADDVTQLIDKTMYQRAIGQLLWLANGTRLDITFTVGVLG